MGAYNREQDTKAGQVRKETCKREETRKEDYALGVQGSQAGLIPDSSDRVLRPGRAINQGRRYRGESIEAHQVGEETGEWQEAGEEAGALTRQYVAQRCPELTGSSAGFSARPGGLK